MYLTYRRARLLPGCVGGIGSLGFLDLLIEVIQFFHQQGHGNTRTSLNTQVNMAQGQTEDKLALSAFIYAEEKC